MRFRTRSRADSAIRVAFFVGVVAASAGIVILMRVPDLRSAGLVLLAVGTAFAVAPCWMSGPSTDGEDAIEPRSDEPSDAR